MAGSDILAAYPAGAGLPGPAKAAMAALVGLALVMLPFVHVPGPEITGVTSLFCALLLVTESATAALLLARFDVERSASMLVLAYAYLFSALMAGLHLITFPGALFLGASVIGNAQSASWLFAAWTLIMPGLAIVAAWLEIRRPGLILAGQPGRQTALAGAAIMAGGVAVLALASTLSLPLPDLVAGGRWTGLFLALQLVSTLLMLAAVAIIATGPGTRSGLFAWFAVALLAMAVANLCAAVGGERYTLGWTVARLAYGAAASVLFVFFIVMFARQQRELSDTRDRLEGEVARRTAELRQMVSDRDALLGEVYHRVNNNLQIIRSMLDMERRELPDQAACAAIERMDRRTLGLGVVHQRAMRNRGEGGVDVGDIMRDLAARLEVMLALPDRGLRLTVEADMAQVPLETAVPLGLLIQELVADAVDRIPPDHQDASLLLCFQKDGDQRRLDVTVEGAPAGPICNTTGNRIIARLVNQLGGREVLTGKGSAARSIWF